jgi:hypothetical protein
VAVGGYGSGRHKQHQSTSSFLAIDTTVLRKRGLLTSEELKTGATILFTLRQKSVKEHITERTYEMSLLINRYGSQEGTFTRWDAIGHVSIKYDVQLPDTEKKPTRTLDLPLITTHPNFGGRRYWFLAPCCGARVRVLYLSALAYDETPATIPACRSCLGLHYASQQQSYIERHKTYERLLLANYGYTWAQWEYSKLKEHYQEITPQWQYIMQKSVAERDLELTEHLISFNRVMLRTHMYALRSLKSADDRLTYLAHLIQTHGQSYALDLVRTTRMSDQIQKDIAGLSQDDFEQAYLKEAEADGKYPTEPTSLHSLIERKKEIQDELKRLKPAA